MATPHVTGCGALYLEANPTATPAQVATGLIARHLRRHHRRPVRHRERLLYSVIGSAASGSSGHPGPELPRRRRHRCLDQPDPELERVVRGDEL